MCVEEPTVIVITEVPEPGAGILAGLKLIVVPDGAPEAERIIALLKPLLIVVVSVEVPCLPCITLREAGEAEIEKFAAPVTVRVTVADC
jgi:hypothetical protein